jgi:hypothetical protein
VRRKEPRDVCAKLRVADARGVEVGVSGGSVYERGVIEDGPQLLVVVRSHILRVKNMDRMAAFEEVGAGFSPPTRAT